MTWIRLRLEIEAPKSSHYLIVIQETVLESGYPGPENAEQQDVPGSTKSMFYDER